MVYLVNFMPDMIYHVSCTQQCTRLCEWFIMETLCLSFIEIYSVKSFDKIYLKKKGLLLPRFKIERMNNLLSYNDVGGYMPPLDKGSLTRMDDARKVWFDALVQRFKFRGDFVYDIAKADGSENFRIARVFAFRDKSDVSFVNIVRHIGSNVKVRNNIVNILPNPAPGGLRISEVCVPIQKF